MLDPHSTAAERLALARACGVFYSKQSETYWRDKWSKECFERELPIVHAITAPAPDSGAVRVNYRSTPYCLNEIGQAIARWLIQEHGGHICRVDHDIVECLRISATGAGILLAHLLKRDDILYPAEGVRGW